MRKERKAQREKREKLISQYMSEYQAILLIPNEDPQAWLARGDGYVRGLKLIAEREIHKLMRAKEVNHIGS